MVWLVVTYDYFGRGLNLYRAFRSESTADAYATKARDNAWEIAIIKLDWSD